MEISDSLQPAVELEAQQEFENPTGDFGERIEQIVFGHTFEVIDEELKFEFNNWADLWVSPEFSWRDFIHWVWRKIVEWWNNLWR